MSGGAACSKISFGESLIVAPSPKEFLANKRYYARREACVFDALSMEPDSYASGCGCCEPLGDLRIESRSDRA